MQALLTSVILLYNSSVKSSNVEQSEEFFIAKKKLGLVPTFSMSIFTFSLRISVSLRIIAERLDFIGFLVSEIA